MPRTTFQTKPPAALKKIPPHPGIYMFKDRRGKIIYIGKANNLKQRTRSYFAAGAKLTATKQMMVDKIDDLDVIILDNELEALLLEMTLIKKHRPYYNILLKDDKNYQYLRIDYLDDFPKIHKVRQLAKDGAHYFGPFTDGLALNRTIKLLNKMFPFRDCDDTIRKNKNSRRRPCLKFYLKKCLAPCVGAVTKEKYNELIRHCELFLAGQYDDVIKNLQKEMAAQSAAKKYEEAATTRDQIAAIKSIVTKQKVVSPKNTNQDIISLYQNKIGAAINVFVVRQGKLIGKENYLLSRGSTAEVISAFLKQYYQLKDNVPEEILVTALPEDHTTLTAWLSQKNSRVAITAPRRGNKAKLHRLGQTNAKQYLSMPTHERPFSAGQSINALKELQKKLSLPKFPARIECYDISNIQGKYATGSMVVFKNGRPEKKSYRRFQIKTVWQPDDPRMMQEMLARRFGHAGKSGWPLPDLIILDGGKGQLSAVQQILRQKKIDLPLAAIAKKEELIFLPNLTKPIALPSASSTLYLVQNIRDAAHRQAVNYHRLLRKKAIKSRLDDIPGVGSKTKKKLLAKFGNADNIKNAPLKKLTSITKNKTTSLHLKQML